MLDRAQALGRLPSVVAGICEQGALTWTGIAGDGGALDAQYRIGSITKTLTAVLVLQSRDDGSIDLDAPLGEHVAESGYADVPLRSLLGHSSGMQAEPVGPWWERTPGGTVAQLLAANDGTGRVLAPGSAFHYSNLGFALLGEVVARLGGRTWFELITERLLHPLGMTRTSYLPSGEHAQGYSVGHFSGTLTREPPTDTGAMAPAGQLWSTLDDLARWVDFLAVGHPDVLGPGTLAEMRGPAPFEDYGLGLRRIVAEGRTWIGHTGSMPGFLACAFVDPATREGVVALSNATTGLATEEFPAQLIAGAEPFEAERWSPSPEPPPRVTELLGIWFWGNTAHELRWSNQLLELRTLDPAVVCDRFAVEPARIRGVEGYLLGESLVIERDSRSQVISWECATFRFTRTPYPADD